MNFFDFQPSKSLPVDVSHSICNSFSFTPYCRIRKPMNPHVDILHKTDKTIRPKPIPGWPVEPEIFTNRRRKGKTVRPYLVRHPKMEFKLPGTGPGASIGPGNGGGVPADHVKVTIAVSTQIDTPRPENGFYSDKELKDLYDKDRILINCKCTFIDAYNGIM